MTTPDWDAYRFVFDVLQTLFMAALGIYAWWTSRSRATTSAINQVEIRMEELNRRVDKVEHDISHLPRPRRHWRHPRKGLTRSPPL